MSAVKRKKSESESSSSDDAAGKDEQASSSTAAASQNNVDLLVSEKEQVYDRIKSKVEILDCSFLPNRNDMIAVGLINGKLKIYDASKSKNRLASAMKLHKKSIRKLAFNLNNQEQIFTASKDKSIKLTDLTKQETVLNLENAHEAPINCLKVIDEWLIATADDDGCVKIWDYRRNKANMESKTDCEDYISDLAVSADKKTLLATCGEGTLTAFHIKKKKMILQSELMDSEMLCVDFIKNGTKVICGTGEGVINIFNKNEYGNISDRFPGHPSSIDCILPIAPSVALTGCFDGKIRACHILPNRFLGVVGSHDEFPIQHLALSGDGNICASISHDELVKFWNVEHIKSIEVDAQSKSKNKSLKNKKLNQKGKSDNFFCDIIDEDEEEDDSDDSDDEDGQESESEDSSEGSTDSDDD